MHINATLPLWKRQRESVPLLFNFLSFCRAFALTLGGSPKQNKIAKVGNLFLIAVVAKGSVIPIVTNGFGVKALSFSKEQEDYRDISAPNPGCERRFSSS
jgi:hypothetical protein